jgi:hypothetical protein
MTIAELFAKLTIKPDKKSFDAADKILTGIKTALLAIVAVRTGQFFAGMVQDTAELGGKIDDLAQSTGQSRTGLQELSYAGDQAGMSMEDTNGIITKLSKNLYEAANGNKEMAKTFASAGIAVRNADGTLRPAADVLEDVGDLIAGMPDGTKKTALAMELLGKSGAKAIPLLNEGGDGIRKLREEAHELGAVMSDETVRGLDEFGDTQSKVKAALIGLRNEAVAALLPTLKEMVTGLLAWIKANREVIKQKIQSIIKAMATGLKFLAKVVGFVITVVDKMGQHLDLVAVALAWLVIAIGVFKAASVAAAIASGIAWAIAHLPLLLLMAAIAAVILIVEDLYNAAVAYLNWDTIAERIKTAFGEALEWVKRKAEEAWDAITGSFDADGAARHFARQVHDRGGITDDQLAHTERFGFGGGTIGQEAEFLQERMMNPMINMPATEGASAPSNSFSAKIQIDGSKDPAATGQAVQTALESFWSGQMRKAAAQSGSGR